MAELKIRLNQSEVDKIVLGHISRKFQIKESADLQLRWIPEDGVTIFTEDAPSTDSSWLDTND